MRGGREHAWKRAALLLAAGAAAAGGCAWAVQGKLTTAWYEVPLPAGLEGLDGVKIAQISDVHSADLERPLGAALAAAAPDLIVMTGDLGGPGTEPGAVPGPDGGGDRPGLFCPGQP